MLLLIITSVILCVIYACYLLNRFEIMFAIQKTLVVFIITSVKKNKENIRL